MNQTAKTPSERRIGRRYMLELGLATVAYAVILVLSIHLLKTAGLTGALRDLVAVTPAIPMIAVIFAVMRFIGSVDELQRQIHIEALAVAAGITAALGLTYTFLEGVGFPSVQAWWAFASVDLCWALSLPFIARRYK